MGITWIAVPISAPQDHVISNIIRLFRNRCEYKLSIAFVVIRRAGPGGRCNALAAFLMEMGEFGMAGVAEIDV